MSTENTVPETANQNQAELPGRSKISNGTIINVVLFIGLIVLYTINFLPSSKEEAAEGEEIAMLAEKIAEGSFNIAFVKSDSLMANYKLALKLKEDFDAEQRRLDADLQRRQRTFQTEVETFQRQMQNQTITMENAQRKEQELMQLQQELIQLNDSYTSRLVTREREMTLELYEKITGFLNRYNKDIGFDYIFSFSQGSGILYARDQHDITDIIVKKLNEEYDAGL